MGATQQVLMWPDSWATEEWAVMASGSTMRYYSAAYGAGTLTQIVSVTAPGSTGRNLATDGTFVFHRGDAAGGDLSQWAWNGSTLTSRYEASTGSSNGIDKDIYVIPTNVGTVLYVGAEDFGHGLAAVPYQSAPAYSWGTKATYESGNDNWYTIMDFRVGAIGTRAYGSTIVMGGGAASQDMRVFTASGTTLTSHATVSNSLSTNGQIGWNRDTGVIVTGSTSSTTVNIHQLNMSTRAISSTGTGTAATNVYGVACAKTFVIIWGTDDILRSYSLSGTTLTLVDTLDINTNGSSTDYLTVSPYSDKIYLMMQSFMKAIDITSAGELTEVASVGTGSAANGHNIVFLPTALPTV